MCEEQASCFGHAEYAKNLLNGHLLTTGAAERSQAKEGINEATSMTKP
jgi:hypothetical protein